MPPGSESIPEVTGVTAEQLMAGDSSPPPSSAAASPPPPQHPAAPPSAAPESELDQNSFAGQKDSLDREFHPAKFRLKDGKPQLDTKGRFVPLGLGSKPKSETPSDLDNAPVSSLPADDAPGFASVSVEITAELSAETAIGLVQTALIMIGDDEGTLTPLEERMLKRPMVRVLEKYKIGDKMTPEMELAAVIAVLFQRRLKKPKTQKWFQGMMAKAHAWWTAQKIRRAVPDPVHGRT